MPGLDERMVIVLRGAALGLTVAAPVGPTCLLCIRHTLAGGARSGLATGYGATTTHVIYGVVAVVGMAAVSDLLDGWSLALKLFCAAFLLRMAAQTVRRAPVLAGVGPQVIGAGRAYLCGLAWTLANPVTVLSFAALAPGVLDGGREPWDDLPLLAAGVALGSGAWWTGVVAVVAIARHRLDPRRLRAANLATGAALAAFAGAVLVDAAQSSIWRAPGAHGPCPPSSASGKQGGILHGGRVDRG